MTEPVVPPEPTELRSTPPDKPPGKGDVLAIGIGCAVFVIMFIAIVLVGMAER
jgi:hypothetical protein